MASKKILAQLELQTVSSLTSPASGFVGFSAKVDGLYQKIGTAPELRLLTSADVQNAILADGSITGAVSQAQIFTMGVKLYNLTQGYIPFASGSTKLLSNSPIYTDGTNVGIGTTNPLQKLDVSGNISTFGKSPATFFPNGAFVAYNSTGNSTYGSGMSVIAKDASFGGFTVGYESTDTNKWLIGISNGITDRTSLNFFEDSLSAKPRLTIATGGYVGIGTTTPGKKLSVGLAAAANGVDGDILSSALATGTGYGSSMIWNMYVAGGNANSILAKIQPSIYQPTRSYLNSLDFFVGDWNNNNDAGTAKMTIQSGGNVGIGTTAPNQQLEITKNFRLPSTTGTTPYGIIYKGTTPFIHDFNYGNNGTVTTVGGNTFVGLNAGNFTMGSTATQNYNSSFNTGIGLQSLYLNTTGYNNSAIGVNSLYSNTIGSGNIAFGLGAGQYIANGTTGRTTGNNGLYLGVNSKASADGTDNEIVIGYNAIGVGSNKTVIGNSSVTDTYFGSSAGSSKLWALALNLSSLTASKVVFTDGSKNLTSTGIGTSSQFIKGDGSLDSNTYITSGSISGFVPYVGATENVQLGSHDLHCSVINTSNAIIGNILVFTDTIVEGEQGVYMYTGLKLATYNSDALYYSYGNDKLKVSESGDVSIDKALFVGNYTGGYLSVAAADSGYENLSFYSKDTVDNSGIIQIIANPEEGIFLRAVSNDESSDSHLEIRHWELGFYTNLQKRLEIVQNGSINAFGNTITSTGGFIGNASTATKLQTARNITVGNKTLSFDGTQNLTYSLADIGVLTGSGVAERITFWNGTNTLSSSPNLMWLNDYNTLSTYSINLAYSFKLGSSTTAGYVLTTDANGNGTWQAPTGGSYTLPTASASVLGGVKIGSGINISSGVISVFTNYQAPITTGTTAQYFRGDLSLATFPTIHTGSGADGRITFWNGTNSLSSSAYLIWDNTYNTLSTYSINLAYNFKLGSSTTAGYVLTTDANGNGTWQAPTGGGSYTLPTATASVLGGVKIGSGITISSGVISVSTNYQAPITTGTTSQYLRGDLSLATFPTIHTGSGFNGGVTFWNGANSLFAATELTWNNTSKNLTITGGLIVNSVLSNSMSTNVLSTQSFNLGSYVTAGYVLTADVNGNGTWKAPTYTLPTASSSVLGGVKVGYGLQIDAAVLSVNPSAFVPYTGADRDVNLASYSIYAYDFLIYSDINLKCNIEDIEMKKLDINYKQFEYKTSRGEKRYGVIAQELLSIAPEFVSESNNSYAVKYTDLLIYEVAQLKEEVKQLKSLLCR